MLLHYVWQNDREYFVYNFDKFKRVVVILPSNVVKVMPNYEYNCCPPRLNSAATLPCKLNNAHDISLLHRNVITDQVQENSCDLQFHQI